LTEKQMKLLLAGPQRLMENQAIDPHDAWRDRLAMELLYGAGLRVSELAGLTYDALDEESAVVRVRGKGNKERLCPIGRVALAVLRHFRDHHARPAGPNQPILVNRDGTRMPVRAVQLMLKRYLTLAGLPLDHAAQTPPLARYASLMPESEPAPGAGIAGARAAHHDPSLHPRQRRATQRDLRQGAPAGLSRRRPHAIRVKIVRVRRGVGGGFLAESGM
jgi:integrase